ncbi:hypothetical protein BGY98DRAFT_956676 [Russula aff. rugulosa BPL654]|nr:hypothetical protein BGY98DRAFT_956676 [Russula aff. rugulosa BPL654]
MINIPPFAWSHGGTTLRPKLLLPPDHSIPHQHGEALPFPTRFGPSPTKPLPIPNAHHDPTGDIHECLRQAR